MQKQDRTVEMIEYKKRNDETKTERDARNERLDDTEENDNDWKRKH